MSRPAVPRAIRNLALVRTWPVWTLPAALRGYVLAVIGAGAAATVAAAATTSWLPRDGLLFAALLLFGAFTLEVLRKLGEPAGSIKDAHGVWQLAVALLLPPFYSIAAAIAVFILTQWRVRSTLAYRRVFSAAAVGLSYGAASLLFHAVPQRIATPQHGPGDLVWVAAAVAAALMRWVLNNLLVLAAVKIDDPAARIEDLLGGREGLFHDAAECSIGVIVALVAAITPATLLLALPLGALLQRSSRHSQLVQASRTDSKTGLLTATAWRTEADVEIARAQRSGSSLAVLMIDVDHFKQVNDTHGHLAGDGVLVAIAEQLKSDGDWLNDSRSDPAGDGVLLAIAEQLRSDSRPYDIAGRVAGRFGGEEFILLFPDTNSKQARQLAERYRRQLNLVTVDAAGLPSITVSIGVAVLTEDIQTIDDLIRAADLALYQAKKLGRNQVQVAGEMAAPPTPEGLSPQSPRAQYGRQIGAGCRDHTTRAPDPGGSRAWS